jgi:hypothetical protein
VLTAVSQQSSHLSSLNDKLEMNKLLTAFIHRLCERLTILGANLIGSCVEGLHAEAQAEEQSRLEELARQYESEGKAQIAASLRERAARLTSTDVAADANDILQRVGHEARLSAGRRDCGADAPTLPDFAAYPPLPGKTRRKRAIDRADRSEDVR